MRQHELNRRILRQGLRTVEALEAKSFEAEVHMNGADPNLSSLSLSLCLHTYIPIYSYLHMNIRTCTKLHVCMQTRTHTFRPCGKEWQQQQTGTITTPAQVYRLSSDSRANYLYSPLSIYLCSPLSIDRLM